MVLNLAKRSILDEPDSQSGRARKGSDEVLTANRDTDGISIRIVDGDVGIGREVSAIELRSKIFVPVRITSKRVESERNNDVLTCRE